MAKKKGKVAEKIEETRDRAVDEVKSTVESAKEDATSSAEEFAENLSEKVDELSEKSADMAEHVIDEIKSRKSFSEKLKGLPFRRFGFIGAIVIAVVGSGTAVYFYTQSQKVSSEVLGSVVEQQKEIKELVEMVGELIELPSEEPTIATVSDVGQLKDQAFFANAQNGDKVLIYQSTKKVYLYRPSTRKLIDVAVADLGNPTPSTAPNPQLIATGDATPTPDKNEPVTVTILNGTTTSGLTRIGEAALSSLKNIEVVERDNAVGREYEQNVIVNVGNVSEARITEIANLLDASVENLPEDEETPSADILVILGSEFADANQ